MGEIINLRMERKARSRKRRDAQAEANRAQSSLPGKLRSKARANELLAAKRLSQKKLENPAAAETPEAR